MGQDILTENLTGSVDGELDSVINVDGSNLINDCGYMYGIEVMRKQFPHDVSGLKRVLTRTLSILYSRYGTSITRSAIASSNVNEIHIANPEGIYKTAARMSRISTIKIPLISFDGNNGSYVNSLEAASRYTGIGVSPFCKALFFDHVDV